MGSPAQEHYQVGEVLIDLRNSLHALNGARSFLAEPGQTSEISSIELSADFILSLADSNPLLASLPEVPRETILVNQTGTHPEANLSLLQKLEKIGALLASEDSRLALSDQISAQRTPQVIAQIRDMTRALDGIGTHTPASVPETLEPHASPSAVPHLQGPGDKAAFAETFTLPQSHAGNTAPQGWFAPTQFEEVYTITGAVGSGGMGTVLRVRNEKLGRDEAAKMIQPRPGESESDQKLKLARFHEEVRISAQLAPAGFVQTYDIFITADRKVGFTMELIEGGINLDRIITAYKSVMFEAADDTSSVRQPGRAALEATVLGKDVQDTGAIFSSSNSTPIDTDAQELLGRILRVHSKSGTFSQSEKQLLTKALIDKLIDICHNLQIMHDLGFIHRDIKPANILIDPQGKVRLADAGLAEEIASLASKPPGISGTPQYMAPEQIRGLPAAEGVHTDTYALGAILYEIICGKTQVSLKPGERFSLAMLDPVRNGTIEEARRPGFSSLRFHDLEAICHKAMATDPEKRYRSAASLADELAIWVRGGEVPAYVSSSSRGVRILYGLRSYLVDHPLKAAGIGSSGLLTIAGGLFGLGAYHARSRFDDLSTEARAVYRAHDQQSLSHSLELHRQADTVIAPYAYPLSLFGLSGREENHQTRRILERELIERQQALEALSTFQNRMGTALSAASSDFSTYFGTDQTALLLENALQPFLKDIFSPQSAETLRDAFNNLALELPEQRKCLLLAAQSLESRAFKLPFHPDLGLKLPSDAERGKTLLRNARTLYAELGIPVSTSELLLELRFERDELRVAQGRSSFRSQPTELLPATQPATANSIDQHLHRIEELEIQIRQVPPVSARDYFTLGKIAFYDKADDSEALACFSRALEIAESSTDTQRSRADQAIVFGSMYGKGISLIRLDRHEEANTAFSDARRALQNLHLDRDQEQDLFALVTSKIAHSYLTSFGARVNGDPTRLSENQVATLTALHRQAMSSAPDSIPVLNGYATFLLNRGDYAQADQVFSTLLLHNPDYDYAYTQRAYVRAQQGEVESALTDLLTGFGVVSEDKTCEELHRSLDTFITNHPERLLAEGNLDKIWRCVTALAVCGNQTLKSQGDEAAAPYYQLALKTLELTIRWVEERDGYGKSMIRQFPLFSELHQRHTEEFNSLFQRLDRFQNSARFRGSY